MLKVVVGLVCKFSDWQGRILCPAMLVLMIIVLAEIFMRSILNRPTTWGLELALFIFGGTAVLGGAYVLRHEAHVSMDIFHKRLSPRARAILDLFTSGLFFLFCGMMLYWGVKYASQSWAVHETSWSIWNPPIYPIKTAIPVGAGFIVLQGLAKFVRDLVIAITGKEEL